MAYATPAQLIERHDANAIGDLASDDGVPVSRIDILTDGKVAAALNDASGDIDAALLVGGMYTVAQLSSLTGNGQYTLISICCEIAMARLYQRRPTFSVDDYKKYLELSESRLERLRNGENTFGIAANIEAGLPSVDGPTRVEYSALNLARDRTLNYFPARRLPNNR